MKRHTLKRRELLKSSSRISHILRHGERLHGDCLSFYFLPSPAMSFAVLVRRSTGCAVERNRVKRWVREVYRQERMNIISPCELLILCNRRFRDVGFPVIKADIRRLIQLLNRLLP